MPIGRGAGDEGEQEQRHELRQPDHAHQEGALFDAAGVARDGVDLPADGYALRLHRQGGKHPRPPEQGERAALEHGQGGSGGGQAFLWPLIWLTVDVTRPCLIRFADILSY